MESLQPPAPQEVGGFFGRLLVDGDSRDKFPEEIRASFKGLTETQEGLITKQTGLKKALNAAIEEQAPPPRRKCENGPRQWGQGVLY